MNFDAASGEVGLGAVVCDSNGEILIVIAKFQPFNSPVELAEALTLHEAISKALEVDIHPLRAKIDLLIYVAF